MTAKPDPLAERFSALADSTNDSDWRAVRASARRTSPTVLIVAGAVIVAALAATPALGLHEPILDFFGGKRAPEPVRANFATMDVGAPPGMATGVIAGETRRVMTARLSDGPHTLWVAPTKLGGFCDLWTGMGGGCDRLGAVPLSVSYGGDPFAMTGHADAEYVDAVEIRFADGSTARPDVTWVGPPIDAGFFAYEAPRGRRAVEAVGLDRDGNVVTHHPFALTDRAQVISDAVMDEKEVALEIETARGVARMWTAPTRYDGTCAWFEYLGRRAYVARCMPDRYGWRDGVALRSVAIAGDSFLLGTAGPRFSPLEVRLPGKRLAVEPSDRLVLAYLPNVSAGDTVTVVPATAGEDPRQHGRVLVEQPDD